jgi:hypothetical protein
MFSKLTETMHIAHAVVNELLLWVKDSLNSVESHEAPEPVIGDVLVFGSLLQNLDKRTLVVVAYKLDESGLATVIQESFPHLLRTSPSTRALLLRRHDGKAFGILRVGEHVIQVANLDNQIRLEVFRNGVNLFKGLLGFEREVCVWNNENYFIVN